MTIDTERLKTDESLWPEGATHYYPKVDVFAAGLERGYSNAIPRPTSAREWLVRFREVVRDLERRHLLISGGTSFAHIVTGIRPGNFKL